VKYIVLACVLLVASVVAAVLATKSLPPGGPRSRHWAAIGIATAVVVALTAVFDNVMIATGIMVYSETGTSGITVGLAPLEDFSYPIAAALALPSVWVLLARDRVGGDG